jgi:hypothetical protein
MYLLRFSSVSLAQLVMRITKGALAPSLVTLPVTTLSIALPLMNLTVSKVAFPAPPSFFACGRTHLRGIAGGSEFALVIRFVEASGGQGEEEEEGSNEEENDKDFHFGVCELCCC